MELNRFDVIRQINLYSSENNKDALIKLLCNILDEDDFKKSNEDLVEMIISIGELYGYYSYIKEPKLELDCSECMRRNMYKSADGKMYYNSGQLSLINELINEQKLFISAPTSFGKTKLVLEYIGIAHKNLKNILFLIPTNSLSEEIYVKLMIFNHKNGLSYHVTTNPKISGDNNILILTPEKYLLLLESRNIDFDLYVMDESYKIEDESVINEDNDPLNSRSSKFRRTMDIIASKSGKVIYLSPYTFLIDDSMERFFKKYGIKRVNRQEKYVIKELFNVDSNKDFKMVMNTRGVGYTKNLSGINKAVIISKELSDSTIIYVRYPKEALDFVTRSNSQLDDSIIGGRFKKFLKHIEDNYEFEGSSWYILEGLKKGIGIYVAPMPRYIKREIVNLFNEGELKKLVVTSAFAEGVNSSAKNIIITNDIISSNIKMTALDLLNLSGRAGRFGVHSKGKVFSVKEEIYNRLNDCVDKGVKISNSNYEDGVINQSRTYYDIERIDKDYLNIHELQKLKSVEDYQDKYNLTDEDLNVALSISNRDKLLLYSFFENNNSIAKIEQRRTAIDNLMNSERGDIVSSMKFIFDELVSASIPIKYDAGDIPAYNKNNEFLWGNFYKLHSSGSIKEILMRRKKYIKSIYDRMVKYNDLEETKSWVDEFVTDGEVDDFKLYNQAFKFISNIIEYRIPFYIGFYVSIFKLFCKKNLGNPLLDYDVVEISSNLENKSIDEKYDNLLEFGFSMDMIKKLQSSDGSLELLDDYEKIIYGEFKELV